MNACSLQSLLYAAPSKLSLGLSVHKVFSQTFYKDRDKSHTFLMQILILIIFLKKQNNVKIYGKISLGAVLIVVLGNLVLIWENQWGPQCLLSFKLLAAIFKNTKLH